MNKEANLIIEEAKEYDTKIIESKLENESIEAEIKKVKFT